MYTKTARPRTSLWVRCWSAKTAGVGLIVSQDVSATALADTDGVLAAAGSGYNSVGDTQIRISSTDVSGVTLNQYAGGYVSITDDAGEGYTYRVRGNTATASNVTDLRLYDAIKVLLTTASDIMITGLMTWKARPATAATDAMVVGGSMAAMTANYFGWAQTRGVYTALTDLATVKGDILTLSDGVAGAVQTIGGGGTNAVDLTTEPTVGRCLADGDTTGHTAVFLTLE